MNFEDMNKKMRVFEQSMDQVVIPNMFIVVRLDGRGFTRLTKEICNFEKPYDKRFQAHMSETVKHLMDCGFRITYGYTQSDEISLFFHRDDNTFGRNTRKIISILAGEASAVFSFMLKEVAVFDCRLIPLPNSELVQDYFRWRQEDAHRNALNSHCYWLLREEGVSAVIATEQLSGKSISFKNEFMFSRGINFDKLPTWQKRGTGVYWVDYSKDGFNPVKQKTESAIRRKLYTDIELPLGQPYSDMISEFCVF